MAKTGIIIHHIAGKGNDRMSDKIYMTKICAVFMLPYKIVW